MKKLTKKEIEYIIDYLENDTDEYGTLSTDAQKIINKLNS